LPRSKRRQRLIRTLVTLGLVLLLLPCVLLLLLQLRPIREQALDYALHKVGAQVPGRLNLDDSRWPAVGALELQGLTWTVGPDTLALLDNLRVEIDLSDLLRKDLTIRDFTAAGALIHLPLITLHTASEDTATTEPGEPVFPRAGALPPSPSIAVQRLDLACGRLVLSDQQEVRDIALAGDVELRQDHDPALNLELAAHDKAGAWRLEDGRIHWAPSRTVYSGYGRLLTAQGDPLQLRLGSLDDRRFEAVIESPGANIPYLRFTGLADRDADNARTMDIEGQLHLPLADLTARWPELGPNLEKMPPLEAVDGELAAQLVWRQDGPSGAMSLAVKPNAWLDVARLGLSFEGEISRLDSLVVSGSGLDLYASARGDAEATNAQAYWRFQHSELIADGALSLEMRGEDLTLRTTPIRIARSEEPETVDIRSMAQDGLLRVSRQTELTNIRVTGAVGEITLGGTLHEETLDIDAQLSWPRPPTILKNSLSDTAFSAISERWRDGAPWTISLHAAGKPDSLQAEADLRLPGPWHLSTAPHFGDATVWGTTTGTARVNLIGSRTNLALDLTDTPWLDDCRATVRMDSTDIRLEDLHVSLLGAVLEAGGSLIGDDIAGQANLHITNMDALLQFAGAPADIHGSAAMTLQAGGTRTSPQVQVDLVADGSGEQFNLPEFTAQTEMVDDRLELTIATQQGLTVAERQLDGLNAFYAGAVPGKGDGHLSLHLDADDLKLHSGVQLSLLNGLRAVGDTLDIHLGDRALHLTQPFIVASAAGSDSVSVRDLQLDGSLGRLALGGHLSGGVPVGLLDMVLLQPASLPGLELPESLHPDSLVVKAEAKRDAQTVRIFATGLDAGQYRNLALTAAVDHQSGGLQAVATLTEKADTLAVMTADIPRADLELINDAQGAPVMVDLVLKNLQWPLHPDGGPNDRGVVISGSAALRGTNRKPTGRMDLQVLTRAWPELTAHRLEIHADTGQEAAQSNEIAMTIQLLKGDLPLVQGGLHLPGVITTTPLGFTADRDRDMDAKLTIDKLDLEEFAPLMPVNLGLRGNLDLALSAAGPIDEPALDGHLSLVKGRASLPDGSWVSLEGKTELSGVATRPDVTGLLEIKSGVLRLPDPPVSLHPVGAQPLLWQVAKTAATDSLQRDPVSAAEAAVARVNPQAEVRIAIPSGLWLKGQGLEIELAGDLQLRTVDGRQDIGGELTAKRGYYRFLGRTFQVERGLVSFDQGEELDPALDIAVTTQLNGGLYRVGFSGTLRRPTLKLTSEPELQEGDIMAMLLFGRPLEDLSSDQEGLVQDRARDLVEAYGTAQLEAKLSQQLKVDMVNLRRGGGDDSPDALIIGKHLNRKVLLKYEQVLDEWSAFFVNLEYYLSRHVKLETMISSHDQSAAAVSWSIEY
jgi:TamB, inner membrane protein subunit of TAM complex